MSNIDVKKDKFGLPHVSNDAEPLPQSEFDPVTIEQCIKHMHDLLAALINENGKLPETGSLLSETVTMPDLFTSSNPSEMYWNCDQELSLLLPATSRLLSSQTIRCDYIMNEDTGPAFKRNDSPLSRELIQEHLVTNPAPYIRLLIERGEQQSLVAYPEEPYLYLMTEHTHGDRSMRKMIDPTKPVDSSLFNPNLIPVELWRVFIDDLINAGVISALTPEKQDGEDDTPGRPNRFVEMLGHAAAAFR